MAEYKGKNPRKKDEGFSEVAVIESILQVVLNLLKMLFSSIIKALFGGKGTSAPSAHVRQQLQEGWEQVEMHLMQESTLALAVSEADKLLDASLQYKGVKGTTMGERLKAAQGMFPHELYQQIWNAHKLRNTLAHEIGASTHSDEVKAAVTSFRQAMYHLGVL
jgi:hypothetical protein